MSPSSSFITSIFILLTFSIYFPLPGMQPQLEDLCNRNVFILTLTELTCWYLQCSVSCGNGTQERQVMCSGPEVSVQNCTEPRPITTRNCQAPSCSGMRWPIWSCSGGCGLHVGDFCLPLQVTRGTPSFSGCPGPTQISQPQTYLPVKHTLFIILCDLL